MTTIKTPKALMKASTYPACDVDVAIVGAGYAGLYILHHIRGLGLCARIYDTAGGVGGTWYWNRYPGARVDIESMEYSYSFSEELQQEWEWSERYASQPELLRYLNHVAERLDLLKDIQLNTRVDAAIFDETENNWALEMSTGERVKAKFCIMATGLMSATKLPDFKNLNAYQGKTYVTSKWPHEGVDFTGKRVGVIGTGSSAVQSIPEIAKQAAHLTVFQRTANYCVPSCNKPMDKEFESWVKLNYKEIRERELKSVVGCILINKEMGEGATKSVFEVTPEERQSAFEKCWNAANFSMYSVFTDVLVDIKANQLVADFVSAKIREKVKDPEVAELLVPNDHPIMTKRLCAESGYYETYNRDNVQLVNIKNTPIDEFTEKGLRVGGKEYEFDAVVFATGFDAMTGALTRIDFRGRNGRSLRQEWSETGPRTLLGLMSEGYPNMFMVSGPTSPGAFYQPVLLGEYQGSWIGRLIQYMQKNGKTAIEPTVEAEDEWINHGKEVADRTLFPSANSWYMGANIPGKPRVILSYLGGFVPYSQRCIDAEEHDYKGFSLQEEFEAADLKSA